MAVNHSLKFTNPKGIEVLFGIESALGNATLDTSWNSDYYKLPIIAPPTILNQSADLDIGGDQSGVFIVNSNNTKSRKERQMYEFELQMQGTNAIADLFTKALFKGSATLSNEFSPPLMQHNYAHTSSSNASAVILLKGVNAGSSRDQKLKGCICTGITVSHSIDSNGGFPLVTAKFVTGYKLTDFDGVSDGTITNISDSTSSTLVHLVNLTIARVGDVTDADCDVFLYGYELNVSRTIERVGYSGADFDPEGYVQTGRFDVNGNATFKRDDSTLANIQTYGNSNAMAGFLFQNGSGYDVEVKGKISSSSNAVADDGLRTTMNITGMGDPTPASPSTIIDIDL
tara:strand:+ start:17924 stop:18952 length:1029 start_codon:yes stop_codon:yes gene_type:complete